ncbi:MAG: hypothetical protein ACHQUC_01265 [Chlamydiales bacterium]
MARLMETAQTQQQLLKQIDSLNTRVVLLEISKISLAAELTNIRMEVEGARTYSNYMMGWLTPSERAITKSLSKLSDIIERILREAKL